MNPLPPIPRDQRQIDAEHLKLLSIFHFVGAGLSLIGILFVVLHYTIFSTIFTNPQVWQNAKQPTPMPPPEIFVFFKVFYVVFGGWFLASGVLNVIAGLALRARKHRTFTLVVAAVNCLHMPLGTVLGVFTFVVLLRESVGPPLARRIAYGWKPPPEKQSNFQKGRT